MQALPIAAVVFALTTCLLTGTPRAADQAASPDGAAETADAEKQAEPIKDVFPRFTVVGDWHVTHPWWVDTVTLRPDGTVLTHRMGTTGHWILTGDGGTPVIVFRWNLFGTESVAMVTPDHFRGQVRNGRFMDMRRGNEGVAAERSSDPVLPSR
jgi:hypothetical protein